MTRQFTDIEDSMRDIKNYVYTNSKEPPSALLNDLKNSLNHAFPGTSCRIIIYTKNDDKLFFGMCVYPDITELGYNIIGDIVQTNKPIIVKAYHLELDSKLFDPLLGLTPAELTAIVMHEVGHMTNSSKPIDDVRKALDIYVVRNDDYIRLIESKRYDTILGFAIRDTLIKVTSIFYDKDDEFKADVFAIKNGYMKELESAMNKIYNRGFIINKDVNDKFIVLAWALRLYKNVKMRRIPALRTIAKAKELTPSTLEKRQLIALDRELRLINTDEPSGDIHSKIDVVAAHESYIVLEGNVLGKAIYDIKFGGLKSFETDLYEYRMMVKNIEEQDEAIFLMRQINAHISVLEDMSRKEATSKYKSEKVNDLLDAYRELRTNLAKSVTYKDRFIGLNINYPAIKGLDY